MTDPAEPVAATQHVTVLYDFRRTLLLYYRSFRFCVNQ